MDYHVTLAWYWVDLLIVLAVWELAWKGFALWRAAHKNQLGWFIAILVLNTAGLLPIFYLVRSNRKDIESANEKRNQ